jgi:energy-coupling factor transporter ATP-binding protein EcfA2
MISVRISSDFAVQKNKNLTNTVFTSQKQILLVCSSHDIEAPSTRVGVDLKNSACHDVEDHIEMTSTSQNTIDHDQNECVFENENQFAVNQHPHNSVNGISVAVDLDKLCTLITETNAATLDMDGKDILLLLGTTGSGKTSTMLYLAGTSFMQNEDGEYEVKEFPSSHPELERYKISGSSRSCTRAIQMIPLTVDGHNIVICDTPGFGDTEGIEFDIANGIVMVEALQKAKSVIPVLVLNKGWQYDRFVSLTETLQSILRLTGKKQNIDFSVFRFIFTSYTKRDAKQILNKLTCLLQEIEASDHPQHSTIMIALVSAMIHDISREFLYVDLEENLASKTVNSLLFNQNQTAVTNPSEFFVPFISDKAAITLNHQLVGYMMDIEKLISNDNYRQTIPLALQMKKLLKALRSIQLDLETEAMVNAMIHDISREFLYVDQEDDEATNIFKSLLFNENKTAVTNPSEFFVAFISDKAAITLNHTLIGHMMVIEMLLSNDDYRQALPLALQMKKILKALRSIELDLESDAFCSRILHLIGERFRHNFSQIFHFSEERKDHTLDSLEKLKEIDEYISQFSDDSIKFLEFTEQLESYLSSILKANQSFRLSSNPAEDAWKIVRLEKLSAVLCGMSSFTNDPSCLCNKIVDQVDIHVCQEVDIIIDRIQSSLVPLKDLKKQIVDMNSFAKIVVEFSYPQDSKFLFHKKFRDLLNKIESRLAKLATDLNKFLAKIEWELLEKTFACSSNEILRVGGWRTQLLSAVGSKKWYHSLFRDGWYLYQSTLSRVDENVCSWFCQNIGALEREVNRYDTFATLDVDYALLEKTKHTTEEKLHNFRKICSIVRSWEQFNLKNIDDLVEKTIHLQETFKSHIRDIDQVNRQLIESCRRANLQALDFLRRLRSGNESFAEILAALDEPNCWDHWSTFTAANKLTSVVNGFKKMIGLPAESDKMKGILDEILRICGSQVSASLANIQSLPRRRTKPLQLAFFLLQSRRSELSLFVKLINLRRSSSLRAQLIIDDTIQSQYQCVLFLSNSFEELGQLPLQLIQSHRFDKVGQLLSLWKSASDTWRILRSFADFPLSQLPEFNGATYKFQKGIQECLSYECIVDAFFEELRIVQSQIDAITFDCADESIIAKTTFYKQQAQILLEAKGLATCHDHAQSPEQHSLLTMESLLLSKYLSELEYLEKQLMAEFETFPNDTFNEEKICNLIMNVECIENVFRSSRVSISRRAGWIKNESEKVVQLKFNTMMQALNLDSVDCICKFLVQWKHIGYEITCWRNLINKIIDMMLYASLKKCPKPTLLLMSLSSSLKSLEGNGAVIAGLILSEHSLFDGMMNAVFNESTATQDVDYVLDKLSCLSGDELVILKDLHEYFEQAYVRTVEESMVILLGAKDNNVTEDNDMDPHATSLYFRTKVGDATQNYNTKYCHQVAELTAIMFARWSVMSAKAFFGTRKSTENNANLKKPHPAQVIGTWLMLNVLHTDYQSLENVLLELQTGQGKSIVLGVTAAILALYGYKVDCICYSHFLCTRDYTNFVDLFDCFGVTDHIRYSTIDELVDNFLTIEGHRKRAERVFQGNETVEHHSSCTENSQPKILLVDEVDVFFGREVFSHTSRYGLTLSSDKIIDLIYSAWNTPAGKDLESYTGAEADVVDSYPLEFKEIIRNKVRFLRSRAKKCKNDDDTEYFVANNKIVKKRFDNVSGNYLSDEINFLYIKHSESGEIPKDVARQNISLSVRIAELSYAELLSEYEAIIGITGTLAGLGALSQEILSTKYNMHKQYFIPSVFGSNRLTFSAGNLRGKTRKDLCC